MKKGICAILVLCIFISLSSCKTKQPLTVTSQSSLAVDSLKESVVSENSSTQTTSSKKSDYVFPETSDEEKTVQIPIYGVDTIVASKTFGIDNMIEEITKALKINVNDDNKETPESPNIELMNLIESKAEFKGLKALTNVKYSIYSLEGKLGVYDGKATRDYINHCYHYIVFDKNVPKGLFVTGEQNRMPRPIQVYINFKYNDEKRAILNNLKEFDKQSIINVGKSILGNERELQIVQYIECDLNGDGKVEKIVNFNNVVNNKTFDDEILNIEKSEGIENKYYAVVVILNEDNSVYQFIHKRINLKGLDYQSVFHETFFNVEYICDLNGDSIMDVLSRMGGYEWYGYKTSLLFNDKITDMYKWYFW